MHASETSARSTDQLASEHFLSLPVVIFQDGVESTLLVKYVQQGMFLFFDLLGQP